VFASLPQKEKAFIIASIDLHIESEKKAASKVKTKGR